MHTQNSIELNYSLEHHDILPICVYHPATSAVIECNAHMEPNIQIVHIHGYLKLHFCHGSLIAFLSSGKKCKRIN